MNDIVASSASPSGASAILLSTRENEFSVQVIKSILRGDRGPSDLEETLAVLAELARRKCGNLPPEILVEQVLRVTDGTDWPTRRAAMEALLRRWGFAERDELTVAASPPHGRVHGTYRLTGRRSQKDSLQRRAARPYATELVCLAPPRGSCDCADFLRGSLGLCKHLLVVIDHVPRSPVAWRPRTRSLPNRGKTGQCCAGTRFAAGEARAIGCLGSPLKGDLPRAQLHRARVGAGQRVLQAPKPKDGFRTVCCYHQSTATSLAARSSSWPSTVP